MSGSDGLDRIASLAASAMEPVAGAVMLSGDASTRRFYRIRFVSGRTTVAMVLDGPVDPRTHPQFLVGAHLASSGLPVPRLEASIPSEGVLFYEDLGDLLLQDVAAAGFDGGPGTDAGARAEAERLYDEAVRLLGLLQGEATKRLPADHPAAMSALDEKKFLDELRFFREHYIEGLRGLRFGPRETSLLEAFLGELAREAARPPWVLCHRDYHSRNLLVQGRALRVVDFQDARMGPVAYDLASLLRDSYVAVPPDVERRLMGLFLASGAGPIIEAGTFQERFEIVALQRNLKAIGTFAFQAGVRGKDHYLAYIPATWQRALASAGADPRWRDTMPLLRLCAEP